MLEAIDPWGQYREDLRFAKLTADIANMMGAKKEGRPVTPADFLFDFDELLAKQPVKAQPVDVIEKQVLSYAFAHNLLFEKRQKQVRHFQRLG